VGSNKLQKAPKSGAGEQRHNVGEGLPEIHIRFFNAAFVLAHKLELSFH
jgi:hypothetical protein